MYCLSRSCPEGTRWRDEQAGESQREASKTLDQGAREGARPLDHFGSSTDEAFCLMACSFQLSNECDVVACCQAHECHPRAGISIISDIAQRANCDPECIGAMVGQVGVPTRTVQWPKTRKMMPRRRCKSLALDLCTRRNCSLALSFHHARHLDHKEERMGDHTHPRLKSIRHLMPDPMFQAFPHDGVRPLEFIRARSPSPERIALLMKHPLRENSKRFRPALIQGQRGQGLSV